MMMNEVSPPGVSVIIGDYHFTEEDIIRFATKFDPQYFHTDPERAKNSVLGGLCASGWHICSAWMQINLAFLGKQFGQIAAKGQTPPNMGPAMGIRDLRWLKPVYAGDTVTYSNMLLNQFDLPNHPNRILNEFQIEGVNQKGEKVTSFIPRVIEFK